MDPLCAVTGRGTLEELATQSPVAAVLCRPLTRSLSPPLSVMLRRLWAFRGQPGGQKHPSVLPWKTRDAYKTQCAAPRRDSRECHLPTLSIPPCACNNHILFRRLALCRPASNRPAATVLYYTVLSCPVLSCPVLCPSPHTYAHAHIRIWACVVFWLRACWMDTPLRARQVATVSVAQKTWAAAASPQPRCTALHCTGTADWDWTGWRHWAWLPSERASKAVELLRCAPGLPVPLSPLGSVHCPLSNFYSLGPPVNSKPPFHPSSPD